MARKPNFYNEEQAEIILKRLCNGDTLTSICKDLGLKPDTVFEWTQSHSEFAQSYARARDFQTAVLEDMAVDAACGNLEGVEEINTTSHKGVTHTERKIDNVARSRLQAETYLKIVQRRLGQRITSEIKYIKKNETELAAEMTNEQLLEIARMRVSNGEDHKP